MSRALVIKGANFAENKLTTISFVHDTPCTGITLLSDAINISSLTPVTVEYTVTPTNTTDAVIWTSSDETVAIVANGTITPVGVGTAVITATCGNYSDTVSVSVTLSASPDYDWAYINGTAGGTSTYTPMSNDKNMVAFGSGDEATEYELMPTTESRVANPYAIKLPTNTARLRISANSYDIFYNSTSGVVLWSKNEASGVSEKPANAIKNIGKNEVNFRNGPIVCNVPEGADCVNVMFRLTAAQTDYHSNPDGYATDNGFNIEFLPAE